MYTNHKDNNAFWHQMGDSVYINIVSDRCLDINFIIQKDAIAAEAAASIMKKKERGENEMDNIDR